MWMCILHCATCSPFLNLDAKLTAYTHTHTQMHALNHMRTCTHLYTQMNAFIQSFTCALSHIHTPHLLLLLLLLLCTSCPWLDIGRDREIHLQMGVIELVGRSTWWMVDCHVLSPLLSFRSSQCAILDRSLLTTSI